MTELSFQALSDPASPEDLNDPEFIRSIWAMKPAAECIFVGGRRVDMRLAFSPQPDGGVAPPADGPVTTEAVEQAVLEARERNAAIAELCCSAGLPSIASGLILSSLTVDGARERVEAELWVRSAGLSGDDPATINDFLAAYRGLGRSH